MGRRFDPDRAHTFSLQEAMAIRSRCGAHLAKLGKENSCTSIAQSRIRCSVKAQ